ncbi:MAG TPA: PmoA family protein [Gemmatimonadaceae bacterium]|nr:PmoA family protein [Gemmatimonadaceae bacterium]
MLKTSITCTIPSRCIAVLLTGALSAASSRTIRAQGASAPRVEIVRHDADRRVDVLVDGKPFTSYIWPTTIKKPVLYPIRTASGLVVTRGWPLEPRPGERVDHPHQVGLWFTHEDVNGLDFWNNSTAIPAARAPRMGTIVQRAIRGVHSGAGEGTLDVTTDWVDSHGKALLREDTRFDFGAGPGRRTIDRITTLTALADTVRFNDAKDGMLGMRVARSLEQPADKAEVFTDASGKATAVPKLDNTGVTGRYRSSEGLEGDSVWATRGRWVTLEGRVDGRPVTIAMLDHPGNPGFPTYWHARGYGLFAANPLGARVFSKGKDSLDLRLPPGQSTTFRYRILILDGSATPQEMERYYQAFVR